MADLALSNLVQGFLLDRRSKGLSPRTLEWYEQKLKAFLTYCKATDGPTTASNVVLKLTGYRLGVMLMRAVPLPLRFPMRQLIYCSTLSRA